MMLLHHNVSPCGTSVRVPQNSCCIFGERKHVNAGIGTQKVGGNSSRRAGSQEGSALAAAQEQAFRLNPGLQVCPLL